MGARQSYNLSKRFDQEIKNVPRPFDSLPSHLLCHIFAQITDESAKMRLSRVCHRFHSCIQLEQSWLFNTELNTQRLTSPDSLLAVIERVPQVCTLNLESVQESLGLLRPEVLEHARKFRVSQLRARVDCKDTVAFLKHCLQYSGPSLTHLNLQMVDAEDILINFVAKCNALQDVCFSDITAPPSTVIESLLNKPLRSLELNASQQGGAGKMQGHWLAALMNSVPNYGSIRYSGYTIVSAIDFCRELLPSIARGCLETNISMETVNDEELFEFVRRVPWLLPNVEQVTISPTHLHLIPSACLACMQAFKYVLDSTEHRPHTISLEFTCPRHINIANSFNDALDAVFGSSEGYVIGIYGGTDPFKRTINKGQATVTLICY